MMDKRIGTVRDGKTIWPEVDATGQTYSRPATTVGLDAEHFVVIPVNFVDWRLIETLAQQVAPKRGLKKAVADERNDL